MIKLLLVLSGILICQSLLAQDFMKDYERHLTDSCSKSSSALYLVKNTIGKLRTTTRFVTRHNKADILNADTIYIVNFYEPESGAPSALIWNKKNSCYYHSAAHPSMLSAASPALKVMPDAHKQLNNLIPTFKQWVERADITSYTQYAKEHQQNGELVSFTVGIKQNKHWRFVTSNSYPIKVWRP